MNTTHQSNYILTATKLADFIVHLYSAVEDNITGLESLQVGKEVYYQAIGMGYQPALNLDLGTLEVEVKSYGSQPMQIYKNQVKYHRNSQGVVSDLSVSQDYGQTWTSYKRVPSVYTIGKPVPGMTVDTSMFASYQKALTLGYVTVVTCDTSHT